MIPFNTLDYRKGLVGLFQRTKRADPQLTYARVAEHARVQPSYFSNVLKGRGDFSGDQLFLVCNALKIEEVEADYLALLLEWERSAVVTRKQALKKRIDEIRRDRLRTHRHLKAKPVTLETLDEAAYYLDPFIKIIHVYLDLPTYAREPERIRNELGLSAERLELAIRSLEKLGMVEQDSSGVYKVLIKNRHLPQSSPVCLPHQALLRLKSAEQLSRLPEEKRQHVSVTFSTSSSVAEKIHEEFLRFLSSAETLVKSSSGQRVFQMNFDLFPWSLS